MFLGDLTSAPYVLTAIAGVPHLGIPAGALDAGLLTPLTRDAEDVQMGLLRQHNHATMYTTAPERCAGLRRVP